MSELVQVMTMKASKGLEFPVVALTGVGHMPVPGEGEQEAARVLYVAATRATQRLAIGVGGDGGFGVRLERREGSFEPSEMHRVKAGNDRMGTKNPHFQLGAENI